MYSRWRWKSPRWSTVVALAAVVALGASPGGPGVAAASSGGISVGQLTVDGTASPLGTDSTRPSLGWQLHSPARGDRQTAYRILVASSPKRLNAKEADVWDSGRVRSADSVGVPYVGAELTSSRAYYWTVQVWDAQGRPSRWSPAAHWETGLLNPADWQGAQWISPDTDSSDSWSDFTLDADFTIKSGAASILFRVKDAQDCYMWQINAAQAAGKVLLRPHVQSGGRFTNLDEIDLSPVVTTANANAPHHLTLRAEGSRITTSIDGTQVDTRTDTTLTAGTLGFRSSATNGVSEDALYDNITVRALDGAALFSDDFSTSPDPFFPDTSVTDGQLEPRGDPTLLDAEPNAPMMRRSFSLDGKRVASARAYVFGLGFYELHLNGAKVGDQVLAPAATPYDRRDLYTTYDVTSDLKSGANTVGLWLGNGYDERFNPYGFRWTGPHQAVMLLYVTYTDGHRQTITTDDNWRWSGGPITGNGIYAGESYDARLEKPGWDKPGFDSTAWQPVRTVQAPSQSLTAATLPPIRVTSTLAPVKLTHPKPGVYVYDFGQNIAGWERLHVKGVAGTTVRMRTAEEVGTDGMLDTTTNRSAAATDSFTLGGSHSTETYEPRFTYHGFRYVEVTGYPGTPTSKSLDARVAHADVTSTGTFSSSDPLLDQIWQNNRWSILNNSMSIPTDNPVRDERTPPAMDVQAYHDASIREFGTDGFYANYLQDMPPGTPLPNDGGNAQQPDMGGDPITLAWALYEQYGDRATLAGAYPGMKTFLDTNATNIPGHIWPPNRGFGDWCPPDRSSHANGGLGGPDAGNCTSEVSLVNTALSYLQAVDVSKAARELGHSDDAAHYTQLANAIKDAFNAEFLNAAGDTYGDGRQTTSVLPLAFDMVPARNISKVGAQLVNAILTKDGGHLDTGIFGTRYLMDALAGIGRIDVAMKLLDQRSYPGFGYEITKGATSSWEQWTYASNMETHDHAMFAGINASFYTQLGGIQPTGPGYRTITIAPQIPPGLHHAAASIATVRGKVATSWTNTGGGLTLDVTVPIGSTATVHVPHLGQAHVGVRATSGAQPQHSDGDESLYTVGSGHWEFTVTAHH
ncbi:family 78 glycoside hydrolase catalytic domain [Streptomyces sp. NPDC005799]|uniref:family 78 glycoside hydrolase catalytic domain n=1 Tax=Streptomyces sp. NPDC005799 TaxID=3154678 RepID=UPI0034038049